MKAISAIGLIAVCAVAGSCATTPRAKIRVAEEAALFSCINTYGQLAVKYCLAESEKRCVAQDLEKSCATDDLWTRSR